MMLMIFEDARRVGLRQAPGSALWSTVYVAQLLASRRKA